MSDPANLSELEMLRQVAQTGGGPLSHLILWAVKEIEDLRRQERDRAPLDERLDRIETLIRRNGS